MQLPAGGGRRFANVPQEYQRVVAAKLRAASAALSRHAKQGKNAKHKVRLTALESLQRSSFMDQEKIDDLRGHALLPAAVELAAIPPLYATDGVPFEQKLIFLHYFVAAANWYVAECDPEQELAFGYCDLGLGMGEWGYVSLRELRELFVTTPDGLGLVVERDLYWTERPWADVEHP